jgi:hypothetical protein
MTRKFFGTCALTGDQGPFVKSHLIPRALTRLSRTSEKFIQSGIGEPMVWIPDSWYDLKLVSRVRNSLPYLRCVLTWVAGFANKRGDDERKTEGATGLE